MTLTHIKTVKIIGAGSIGNHLANAARRLGCSVAVTDLDPAALERMRTQIYPSRYGSWDEQIQLCPAGTAPTGRFDLICIGTPPDSHMRLALDALAEAPRALQIEKPLCPPDMAHAEQLRAAAAASQARVFVGYDHLVGRAAGILERVIRDGTIGEITTFDVEFREHWGGIFKAHPWLNGPGDSYLGFWQRGGGASGEHSHAMSFWQHLARLTGSGRIADVSATVRYVRDGQVDYDDCCFCLLRTESGMVGRVVQDVVTQPVAKQALVVGTLGTARWINGYNARGDAVIVSVSGRDPEVIEVPKTRPDDFIWELQHIDASLAPGAPTSPLALEAALETMLAVAAAHRSEETGRRIAIDYSKGMTLEALR